MKSKISLILRFICTGCVGILILQGCKKENTLVIPPPVAHFVSSATYVNYYVRNLAADSFIIQIGTSDVANTDRTVTYKISSPSGAVEGTDYEIVPQGAAKMVTVKAGTAVAPIKLHGIFNGYSSGKKDTLVFTLATPSVEIAEFSDTINVVLQRYCDVVPAALIGDYTNSFDTQAGSPDYGPYTMSITSADVTATGATSGYIILSNFWDVGGPDIRVNLDWADPANFKTTIPAQFLFTDPTYGPATVTGVGSGTFSSCDNKFTFSYKVTVAAGTFGNFITTMAP